MPNYRVAMGQHGGYKLGDILPEHVAAAAGGLDELVTKGRLVATEEPVNVQVSPPRAAPTAPKTVYDERNDLARSLDEHKKALAFAEGQAKEWEKKANGFKVICEKYTEEKAAQAGVIKHLEEACETHQKRIDELEAENKKLTENLKAAAPKSEPKGKKKDEKEPASSVADNTPAG